MPTAHSQKKAMICIPVISETTDEAIALMQRAAASADIVEIRADYLCDPDIERILAAKRTPVIVTITPKQERGRFEGTEQERLALLRRAIQAGADYIDISIRCPELSRIIQDRQKTKVIVSYHNFDQTPKPLDSVYRELAAAGGDIVKIATHAADITDSAEMLHLIRSSSLPVIGLCMGPCGQITRILGPRYGAFLTFASLEQGQESASGQIPCSVMKDIYRVNDLDDSSEIYGIIGNPVSKSKGYLIHNRLFKHYGMNNVYVNFPVSDVGAFVSSFSGMVSGLSVTMPHKQAVMRHLDLVDPAAERIGAVNTVVSRNGSLEGYNTDAAGVVGPLLKRTALSGKRVTMLGAGGAARAAAAGIIDSGGTLIILNRTVGKARRLAEEFGCAWGPLSDFDRVGTDILINMTSVGMHPDTGEMPVSGGGLKNMIVFDGIYNPPKTLLLQEAEKNGCDIISGAEMFLTQAAEQFRLWTGTAPGLDLMQEIWKCVS